jgi:hypothetical protein
MGDIYYTCDTCEHICSADCVHYNAWCDCGGHFCSADCADKGKDENGIYYCCLCRIKIVKNVDLLTFLLKHFKMTREQAVILYREDLGD